MREPCPGFYKSWDTGGQSWDTSLDTSLDTCHPLTHKPREAPSYMREPCPVFVARVGTRLDTAGHSFLLVLLENSQTRMAGPLG